MIVRIKRQKRGGEPFYTDFSYDGGLHITVADLLDNLNYSDDPTDIDGNPCDRIQWECSCLQSVCGACGMVINGIPALACQCFLDTLRIKNDILVIEPLTKFPVIEDLIVDKTVITENMKKLSLWLDSPAVGSDRYRDLRYEAAKCMKCGLCLEVCPNFGDGSYYYGAVTAPEGFLALSQGANKKIKKELNRHFLSGCSKSGACENICPANVKILELVARLSGKIKQN